MRARLAERQSRPRTTKYRPSGVVGCDVDPGFFVLVMLSQTLKGGILSYKFGSAAKLAI